MAGQALSADDLESRVRRIYDYLYANSPIRTPARISHEVQKLLRVAAQLEQEGQPAFDFSAQIVKKLLAGDPARVAEIARSFRARYQAMNLRDGSFTDELRLSDENIAWCVARLNRFVFAGTHRDVFGDAIEIFRTSWAKQRSGQFFTDGRVTALALELLQFAPERGDDLIDICCGTGGFLLAAVEIARQRAAALPEPERAAGFRRMVRGIRGQEVDREIAGVANLSLRSRGIPHDLVRHGDSLERSGFSSADPAGLREGTHRCAASNPPFGTKITIQSPAILRTFDLARRAGGRVSPRAPDVLLLEQNIRMLEPGRGRLAIVIPYQILSGPQSRYVRTWLLKQAHIEAVVDLPPHTFQPHTGTKTALIVVRRRQAPLADPQPSDSARIFMSVPTWIGHDRRGNPVYKTHPSGRATREILTDLPEVARAFAAFKREEPVEDHHADSFVISEEQLFRDSMLRLNARFHQKRIALDQAYQSAAIARTVRLGEVVSRIFCPARFKRSYVPRGPAAVPFLGGASISQLMVTTDKWLSIHDPKLPKLIVREGWLLITRSGTTGVVSSVAQAWDGVAISEHVIRIVPDADLLHPAWIQAYLRSEVGQLALNQGIFGSVIDEITPDFISQLRIPLPEDPALLAQVCAHMVQAERARNEAIGGFGRGMRDLDALFRS